MEYFVSLIVGAVIIYLFLRSMKSGFNKKTVIIPKRAGISPDKGLKEKSNIPPEVTAIHQAATAKIERAKNLGLPKIFEEIYFEQIKNYPSWIKKNLADYVPDIVEQAAELDKKTIQKLSKKLDENIGEHTKAIKLHMKGREYLFLCENHGAPMPDGDFLNWEIFQMFVDMKKVLELHIDVQFGEWKTTYRTTKVSGFIEGDWILDILQLYRSIKDLEKKRNSDFEKKRKTDEAVKMKKNFGL